MGREQLKELKRLQKENERLRRAVFDLTLNKWITAHRDTDVVSKEDLGLAQENEWLRREVRILKEEYPSWSSRFFNPFTMIM